ncbi:MAG: response regulator [Candidatus Methylomirabilales bacterium]
MAQLKSEVDTAQRKLSSYLASIGQDRAGGLQLLEQVRREYRNVPVTFYTRKGTVEDVSACLDAGAVEVLRKPQPDEIDSQSDLYLQMEAATMAHRNSLVSRFEALSSSNSVLKKLAKIARFIWKNWGNF